MKKLLFHPFERYAGLQALLFGLAIALVAALLASWFSTRFDGVLDAHYMPVEVPLSVALIDQVVNGLSLFMVFYAAAWLLGARHVRMVDMLGTLLMARAPYLLIPLFNIGGMFSSRTDGLMRSIEKNPVQPDLSLIWPLLPFMVLTIALVVWTIALYFNAWKVCTNFKGTRLIAGFIVALLAAEALSIFLLFQI